MVVAEKLLGVSATLRPAPLQSLLLKKDTVQPAAEQDEAKNDADGAAQGLVQLPSAAKETVQDGCTPEALGEHTGAEVPVLGKTVRLKPMRKEPLAPDEGDGEADDVEEGA